MSSNFGEIPPLNAALPALERLKNQCIILFTHSSAFIFNRNFFILAGEEDSHNISEEVEIRPTSTTVCGVSCPCASEIIHRRVMGKNVVSTPTPSFLIRCSSFSKVTRTTIKAWMSSDFGRILPLTAELPALGCLRN